MLKPEVLTPAPRRRPLVLRPPWTGREPRQRDRRPAAPSAKEAPNQPGMLTPAPVSEVSGPRTEDTAARKETAGAKPDESTHAAPRSATNPIQDQAVSGMGTAPQYAARSRKFSGIVPMPSAGSPALRPGRGATSAPMPTKTSASRPNRLDTRPEPCPAAPPTKSGVRPAPRPSGIESPSLGSRLPNRAGIRSGTTTSRGRTPHRRARRELLDNLPVVL